MTKQAKVSAASATSTHFPNSEKVDVPGSDAKLTNSQSDMLLNDPEDVESGKTHSDKDVVSHGEKKPVKAGAKEIKAADQLVVPPEDTGGKTHEGNDTSGEDLPIIDNAITADMGEDFDEDELSLASTEDDAEFGDLTADADALAADDDGEDDAEFDELDALEPVTFDTDVDVDETQVDEPEADVVADFENQEASDDDLALLDVDGVADDATDDVVFATVGNSIHVLRSNRIIASMGPALARKAEVSDVYLMPQFQDVLASTLASKGLRKGLVQSGFQLAKVKMTAAKSTAKVVQAKVQTEVQARLKVLAQRDAVMEQSLAIAATGINKHFFKDATNDLKASLVAELEALGVRGADRLVRAAFAKDGVSYAKSILTTAKKIAGMPEQVRENLVAALDMTDGDLEDDAELDVADDADLDDDDGMEEIPATVSAALVRPMIRTASLLKANTSNGAMAILAGTKSLI